MASNGNGPEIIEFLPDLTTKKKKGVHRPIYAEVFTKEVNQGDAVKVIHLMVNPFSGKKKGEKIAQLDILIKDELIKSLPLYAAENLKKVNFFKSLLASINYLIWGDV